MGDESCPSCASALGRLPRAKGERPGFTLTAIFTGLRSSELRGLHWSDIDLKAAKLEVRQRIDQYREFGPPKSAAGERTIPLPPQLLLELREWKLACPKNKDRPDFAFPNPNSGEPETHAALVRQGLAPAWIAAGVTSSAKDKAGKLMKDKDGKPILAAKYTGRLHALRHFYASWCINSEKKGGLGLSHKAAQERLGHSTIGMLLDTYGHLFEKGDDGTELAAAANPFFV